MAERGPEILRCRTAVNMGVLVGRQQRCLGQGWEVPGSRKTECANFMGAGGGGEEVRKGEASRSGKGKEHGVWDLKGKKKIKESNKSKNPPHS